MILYLIVDWMIYAVAVGGLIALAGLVAERGARAVRLPTRWIWGGALLAILVLPFVGSSRPAVDQAVERLTSGEPRRGERAGGAAASAAPEPFLLFTPVDRAAAQRWLLGSGLVLGHVIYSAVRLGKLKRSWSETRLDGAGDVWISTSSGPALVGVLRPRMVLPLWLIDWDPGERDLVVEHERQHLVVRDPLLAALALLAVAAMPWNPFLWWSRRRLLAAIETDCDARVLRTAVDPTRYARALVQVARLTVPLRSVPAALAASTSQLGRRVDLVLEPRIGRRSLVGLVLGCLSLAIAAVPAGVGSPGAPTPGYVTTIFASESPYGPQELPGTPPAGKLEEELARHHPEALENGVGDGERVWFIVDRDQNVLHTGVMAGSNEEIAARLRAEYPDDASEFALGFAVDLTTGVRVPFGTQVEPGTPVVRVTWVPQLR